MDEQKIAEDCKILGMRIFELCKMCDSNGHLPTEKTGELIQAMVAMVTEYKRLYDWLDQAQKALNAYREIQDYTDQCIMEQQILVQFLDAKELRQEYIAFAESLLAQKQLKVVNGGKKQNDRKD